MARLPGLANTVLLCVMAGLLRRSGGALGHSGKPAYGAFFHTSPSTKGHLNNRQCCIFGQEKHTDRTAA